jgi:DNA repair protein RecO (recombination protein O)
MSYLRDHVIVLKKEPFREHDRRYTMYGREHGLLVAVARGASRATSKNAGLLEPLTESNVMIAKGATFDKLAVATAADRICIAPSRCSLSFYAVCGGFADLLVRLLRPGIADERIFDLLRELIDTLAASPSEPSPDRARLMLSAATLRLLDLLGFAPPIERAGESTTPGTSFANDVPRPALALAAFMRRSPLADVLRVTARTDVFSAASAFVEEALTHTPLDREPHGPATIQALLRDSSY